MENTAPAVKPVVKNELLKQASPTLAGTIAQTLADPAADRFSVDDEQFLKFHGIYQQDDRDKRKGGKHWQFMIRGRIPGGIVSPEQYLRFDDLAGRYGNGTLRITSRQSFQWHGVVKSGLGPLMRGIHEALADTLAACGDVNRNVMAPPTPATSPLVDVVWADARLVSEALLPKTPAYHQIWVEGVPLNLSGAPGERPASACTAKAADGSPSAPPPADADFVDPLYGRTYLPRKFKTAFAIPPLNDTDVFTNCLGFVAIADAGDPSRVSGYNLLCGGGLGTSHGGKETFPRLADVLGFLPRGRLVEVAQAVLTAYRDWGDRTNRRHARLKYVLADHGPDWFRAEVEKRLGFALGAPRPMAFTRQGDLFGWHAQTDGRRFLGLYVEAGRIQDSATRRLRSGLRAVVERHRPTVRLTPSQNLLLTDVAPGDVDAITALLAEHGVAVENQAAAVRRASMACPAMPTCGMAITESERVLPGILDTLESALGSLGIPDEEVIVRMTGCPNGCARPYMAEIGLIGKAPGKYNLYFGGNATSTSLNVLHRENMPLEEFGDTVAAVLGRWSRERVGRERLGDFYRRVVLPELEAARPSAPASA